MSSVDRAFTITGRFEGHGYGALSGDFDGQGISYGFIQWNLGQGTLQPLLRAMYAEGPQTFRRCFTQFVADYGKALDLTDQILAVCAMPRAEAVAWARARQTKSGGRPRLLPHWAAAFRELAEIEGFQAVQRRFAEKPYMARAKDYMKAYGFRSDRALCLLFDITVQMGSITAPSRGRYLIATAGRGLSEQAKLVALAKAVAPQGGPWAHDVLARKSAIATGRGTVHGAAFDGSRYGLHDGPATF